MELISDMGWFFYGSAFIFGLVVGSFLNVVIWRWPREESIITPGSYCPKCQKLIAWYDNLPILSFILLKGRCRYCQGKISWRYPMLELMSGLLSLLALWSFGLGKWFFIYYAFFSALFVASVIDLEHRLIPDEISIGGAVIGLGLGFLPGNKIAIFDALLGGLAGFLVLFLVGEIYQLITKKEGMGMGDAKLLGMIGVFLGWRSLPGIIFIASALGAIIGLGLIIINKKDRFYKIPFGPFLSFSAIFWMVVWEKNIKLPIGILGKILGI